MQNFRSFLNSTGLMDLDLKGCKYAWVSNPRDGFLTREKLDRVLANWPWRDVFQHAIGEALPIITFDHCPIFLNFNPKGRGKRYFKYEAYWEDHDECGAVIKQSRDRGSEGQNAWGSLKNKVNECRSSLQSWHRQTFNTADVELKYMKEHLQYLLNQPRAKTDWVLVKQVQEKIDKLWSQEEKFWEAVKLEVYNAV